MHTITPEEAVTELVRRGRVPNSEGVKVKSENEDERKEAILAGTFTLSTKRLAELANMSTSQVSKRQPRSKANSNFDRSNPLGLSQIQLAVREAIREMTSYGQETVLFKSGKRKGEVKSGFDFSRFATLMDQAGIPRKLRDVSTTERPTTTFGSSGKVHVTVGDALATAFAKENGIKLPTS